VRWIPELVVLMGFANRMFLGAALCGADNGYWDKDKAYGV